jgi:Zn-dependent protease with chaperone function
MFASHPPMTERIARLRGLADELGRGPGPGPGPG